MLDVAFSEKHRKASEPFALAGYRKKTSLRQQKSPSSWQHIASYPWLSGLILLLIVLGCMGANLLANHDPTQFYLEHLNEQPGNSFYFGTDALGRDIFSIIWFGGRVSLTVGILGMLVSSLLGIVYGCLSGMASAWLDNLLMRLAEILSSIPSIMLMLLLLAFVHKPNVVSLALVIGVTNWMNMARMVRSEVRQIQNSDYVLAARCMGGGFMYIARHHLLPNFLSPIMFMIVSSIGNTIMLESTLSFLGIGLPVEVISWGSMLSLANRALISNAWWVILIPGAFIIVTMVCITNLGHFLHSEIHCGCSNL